MERKEKDPDDTVDYVFNWVSLATFGDTITDAEFIVEGATDDPGELTIEDSSFSGTTATVWVSGGTDRRNYKLTCRVTTTQGRQEDSTILIVMGEQ